MGWLGKAGRIIGEVTKLVLGIGPLVTMLTPSKKDDLVMAQVADTLAQVAGIITQVEAMAGALATPLPGDQKLLMATPLIAQIVLSSSVMAHHEIGDPVKFRAGCASIASGMADVLTSLKDNVETVNKT